MSNDRGTHAVWHSAAFAVVVLTLAPGLALTGGPRFDHDQAHGNELVPQLNASQQIGKVLTVHGVVGRAIRAPDFTERYNNHGQPALLRTDFNVGNAALQVERTMNCERGPITSRCPASRPISPVFAVRAATRLTTCPRPAAKSSKPWA